MTYIRNSQGMSSAWFLSTLVFSVNAAYADDFALLQVGSSDPTTWVLSAEDDMRASSSSTNYFRAELLVENVPNYITSNIGHSLLSLGSTDSLHIFAPGSSEDYLVDSPAGNLLTLTAHDQTAHPNAVLFPAHIQFLAPFSSSVNGSYSVSSKLQVDTGATLSLQTLPNGETIASQIQLNGELLGAGDIILEGGGDYYLNAPSMNFEGGLSVGGEGEEEGNTLYIEQALQVRSLNGLGQVHLSLDTLPEENYALMFQVPENATGGVHTIVHGDSTQTVRKAGLGVLEAHSRGHDFSGDMVVEEGTFKLMGDTLFFDHEKIAGPSGMGILRATGSSAVLDLNGHTFSGEIALANGALLTNSNSTDNATILGLGDALSIDSTTRFSNAGDISQEQYFMDIQADITKAGDDPVNLHIERGGVILRGANTYGGDTYIGEVSPAVLAITSMQSIGAGSVYVKDGSVLDIRISDNNLEWNQPIVMSGDSRLIFDPVESGSVLKILNNIEAEQSESGVSTIEVAENMAVEVQSLSQYSDINRGYTKAGLGLLTVKASSSFFNPFIVSEGNLNFSGSVITLGTYDPSGNNSVLAPLNVESSQSQVDVSGASLVVVGALSGAGQIKMGVGAHGLVTVNNGAPTSFSGQIQDGEALAVNALSSAVFTKGGTGSLTLSGDNTNYSGSISIVRNSKIIASNNLKARYIYGGTGEYGEIEVLDGYEIQLLGGAGNRPHNAKVTGLGQVIKKSTNTLVLAQNLSTYSGGTVIQNGTMQLGTSSIWSSENEALTSGPLGVGAVTIDSSGVLDLYGGTIDNSIELAGVLRNTSSSPAVISEHSLISLSNTPRLQGSTQGELQIFASLEKLSPSDPDISLYATEGNILLAGANNAANELIIQSAAVRVGAPTVANGSVIESSPVGLGSVVVGTTGILDLNGFDIYSPVVLSGRLKNSSMTTGGAIHSASITLSSNSIIDAGAQGHTLTLNSPLLQSESVGTAAPLNIAQGTVVLQSATAHNYAGSTDIGTEGAAILKISRNAHIPDGSRITIYEGSRLDLGAELFTFGSSQQVRDIHIMGELRHFVENNYISPQQPATYGMIHGNISRGPLAENNIPGVINIVEPASRVYLQEGLNDYTVQNGPIVRGFFNKTGPGELMLEGSNSMTGTLNILEGMVSLGQAGRHNPSVSIQLASGASWGLENPFDQIELSPGTYQALPVTIEIAELSGTGGTVFLGSNSLNISGSASTETGAVFTGTSAIIRSGSGTTTFTGDNSEFYGELKIAPEAHVILENDFKVKAISTYSDQSNTVGGDIAIGLDALLIMDTQGADQILRNQLTGLGGLAIYAGNSYSGPKTVQLMAADRTYAGGTELHYGVLQVYGSTTYQGPTLVSSPLGLNAVVVRANADLQALTNVIPNSIALQGTLSAIGASQISEVDFTGEEIVLLDSTARFYVEDGIYSKIYSKITGFPGIVKTGLGMLSLVNTESDYQGRVVVQEGSIFFENQVKPRGHIELYSNTDVYFTNTALQPMTIASSIVQHALSVDQAGGTVHFSGGYFNYTGELDSNLEKVYIHGSENSMDLACVYMQPTEALPRVHLSGELDLELNHDLVWSSKLWGSGVLRKYGAGDLTLTADVIGNEFFDGSIRVSEGILKLNPGLNLMGALCFADGGHLIVQGELGHQAVRTGWIDASNGTLSIYTSRTGVEATGQTLLTHSLTTNNTSLIIRPEFPLHSADIPALRVIGEWELAEESTVDIRLLPKGIVGDLPMTMSILSVGGAVLQSSPSLAARLVSSVSTSPLYNISNIAFTSEGVLQCQLARKSAADILGSEHLAGMAMEYRTLGEAILSLEAGASGFTEELYDFLATASSFETLEQRIKMLFPSSAREIFANKKSSMASMNMIGSIRIGNEAQSFMSQQGVARTKAQNWASKLSQAAIASQKDFVRQHTHGAGAEEDIALIDYQHINLKGLSFSSSSSYSHEVQAKQREDSPGVTQSTWGSSLGVTHSTPAGSAIGATVSFSKTRQHLNANEDLKTEVRSDRYNNGGVMALLQSSLWRGYASGMMTYGEHKYTQTRSWVQDVVNSSPQTIQADSEYKGYEFYSAMEMGWKLVRQENFFLQPYAGMSLSRLSVGAYTESAINQETQESSSYGIAFKAQAQTTHEYQIGVEMMTLSKTESHTYQVSTRIGFSTRKVSGDTTTIEYAYVGALETPMYTEIENVRYNSADISFGVYSNIKDNLAVSVFCTGQFGQYQNTGTILAKFEYEIG